MLPLSCHIPPTGWTKRLSQMWDQPKRSAISKLARLLDGEKQGNHRCNKKNVTKARLILPQKGLFEKLRRPRKDFVARTTNAKIGEETLFPQFRWQLRPRRIIFRFWGPEVHFLKTRFCAKNIWKAFFDKFGSILFLRAIFSVSLVHSFSFSLSLSLSLSLSYSAHARILKALTPKHTCKDTHTHSNVHKDTLSLFLCGETEFYFVINFLSLGTHLIRTKEEFWSSQQQQQKKQGPSNILKNQYRIFEGKSGWKLSRYWVPWGQWRDAIDQSF